MYSWQRFSPILCFFFFPSLDCFLGCIERFSSSCPLLVLIPGQLKFCSESPSLLLRLVDYGLYFLLAVVIFLLSNRSIWTTGHNISVYGHPVFPATFVEDPDLHCMFSTSLCQVVDGCSYEYPWLGLLYFSNTILSCLSCASSTLFLLL